MWPSLNSVLAWKCLPYFWWDWSFGSLLIYSVQIYDCSLPVQEIPSPENPSGHGPHEAVGGSVNTFSIHSEKYAELLAYTKHGFTSGWQATKTKRFMELMIWICKIFEPLLLSYSFITKIWLMVLIHTDYLSLQELLPWVGKDNSYWAC